MRECKGGTRCNANPARDRVQKAGKVFLQLPVAENGVCINSASPKFMAKRFLLVAVLFALAFIRPISAAKLPQGEWIIVVGGVSMNR